MTFVQSDEVTWPDQKNFAMLWLLRHWLQYRQLRTWIHDILCYPTINCDTGQHSQFLRCFYQYPTFKLFNDILQNSCRPLISAYLPEAAIKCPVRSSLNPHNPLCSKTHKTSHHPQNWDNIRTYLCNFKGRKIPSVHSANSNPVLGLGKICGNI